MAIPHLNVTVITRGQGQSAVASASYRSGEALYNELENKLHDYTRKQDVRYKEIIAPADAPEWVFDRGKLWNNVEAAEKRKDARFARSVTIALPRELNLEQNTVLVANFAKENFVSQGMIADLAIHDAKASDGGKNPHAHIMLTLREVDATGFGKKNREWDDVRRLESWRDAWERCVNHTLAQAGADGRISMKSYSEQGIDKRPTKHLGVDAWQLEKQGVETHVGNTNRKVHHLNALHEILKSQWGEPEATDQEQPISPQPALNRLVTENGNPDSAADPELDQERARHRAALWEILQERWGTHQEVIDAPEQATGQQAQENHPLLEQYRNTQHAAQTRLATETTAHKPEDTSTMNPGRAEHLAALRERLLAPDAIITRQQKIRLNIIRQYTDLLAERAAEIARAAARQYKTLRQEARRLKQTEQGHER